MKNIIITGGGFGNKGAEAMTYISVFELKKRFPNHKIYVYIPDEKKIPLEKKRMFNFEFLGWNPIKFARAQKNPLLKIACLIRNKDEFLAANEVYSNAELMVDISGYALGSNWSEKICTDFLNNIEFAHAYGISVYLMPQSFGPFDFSGKEGKKINERIAKLLPKVKMICAREKEGYGYLTERYHLKNVYIKADIVLNNRFIEYSSVFRKMPDLVIPSIIKNSVCLIPNEKVFEFGQMDMQSLYCTMVSMFLAEKKNVYLMYHSSVDRKRCVDIKKEFLNEEKVIFLDRDYSCIEFNEIVKQFQFVVGSRFHSIVHALKNGVPCIALGWAIKYHELLAEFEQQRYFFDMRRNISAEMIFNRIKEMERDYLKESKIILSHLRLIQKNNVFDEVINNK